MIETINNSSIQEGLKSINFFIKIPFVQMIFNVLLSGGLFYWIQRKHKRNDEFKIEKNKRIAEKEINCELQLFDKLNSVKLTSINGFDSAALSDEILNFIILNDMYLSDELLKISREFSDYLLELTVDPANKSVKKENILIKKFKALVKNK